MEENTAKVLKLGIAGFFFLQKMELSLNGTEYSQSAQTWHCCFFQKMELS
jgi:hypothetical protein